MSDKKPKTKKPVTRVPRRVTDWASIRQEWDLGQLDVAEIGRQYGVSHSAVFVRAKRHAWPPRPEKIPCVTELVTRLTRETESVTNPRHALTAFGRVMGRITIHRRYIREVLDDIALCREDIRRYRVRAESANRELRLDEIATIMDINSRTSQALHRLIPMERRALGLNDDEVLSEFDSFTQAELDAVETVVRQALDT